MGDDDPFHSPNLDRTVILPSPRGRSAAPPQGAGTGGAFSGDQAASMDVAASSSGLNPLLAAANPLLNVAVQLRTTVQHPDPVGLREGLARGIKAFEARAKAAQIAPEKILVARYALCTLLDEFAALTPWGGSGAWAKQSLLVMFHNETYGGEKFFQLVNKLADNPTANRDILEFMYACLALGFQGRYYRLSDNGQAKLDELRERLAAMLRKEQGEYERDLAVHWQSTAPRRNAVLTVLPLWVVIAVCAGVLFAAYLGFSFSLNGISDPVFARIQSFHIEAAAPRPHNPAAQPRLAKLLAIEIAQGLVNVRDEADLSVVTLKGDGLFTSGSDTMSEGLVPLLERIGEELNKLPGQILVTGHTDSRPIRSARFPSNWHLSQARAEVVQKLLANQVSAARITAEGRAEAEPVADNNTPEGRARNRRVEITLFGAQP